MQKADILEPVNENVEERKYITLKWGLVAIFAGAGIILIEALSNFNGLRWMKDGGSLLPLGIELVFIAGGFLTYFFIVNSKKK